MYLLISKSFMLKNVAKCTTYHYKRNIHKWTSKKTRQQFLDYFIKENDHNFIRSSPVVPFCDPTVAFVNAGMNQFKGIFLGRQNPTYTKVANSQKCVRVGGKHNDLSVVGSDGHHHTFFEMLGNWSFGDYFKKEACSLAWNLLTGPYKINPSSLYVTYFGGDRSLNLDADLECKDIWRSLGVSEDRIIPFGLKENFWEMGLTGPCGPCTEIHIDHTKSNALRSDQVNKDLPDLTELWNIVFIQYNRDENGNIHPLPKQHVDTGMGFERLTAILQEKSSNYDTDIFTSLFDTITKNCTGLPNYRGHFGKNDQQGLDAAYRVLADHSRTVTVCLADGMIPEQNQKLRKILRKCLYLSETTFKNDNLLKELCFQIAENLGDVYPEIPKNINQVQEIILYEKEVYKSLRQTAVKDWSNIIKTNKKLQNLDVIEMPGLVSAYNELKTTKVDKINSDLAFKLYDTHGLDENTIKNLSESLNLTYDSQILKNELDIARKRTKQEFLTINSLPNIFKSLQHTNKNHDAKYDYIRKQNNYIFNDLDVNILHIICNDKFVNEIKENTECYIILNKTNFYTEAGGQCSDKGTIKFSDKIFEVKDVININGNILHKGILTNSTLKVGESGALTLDKNRRLQTMANHTSVHLLNAAIKKVLNVTTCQKSSAVFSDYLNFDVGIYSQKLSIENIEDIERLIRENIKNSVNVETKLVNSQELLSLDNVTLIPGEIYPENDIRLININDRDINFFSCEPCCGTHVLKTSDIVDFCITNYKSLGRSTASLTAVTRDKAILAHKNGQIILEQVEKLQEKSFENVDEIKDVDDSITKLKNKITKYSDDNLLPVYIKTKCLNMLNEISKKIRGTERGLLKDLINLEMKTVLTSNQVKSKSDKSFIVHFLECSSILENVQLQQATKICPEIPIIIISCSESMVKARCCVPKEFTKEDFNAETWLSRTIGNTFKSSCSAPKGQDATLVCNMKTRKINSENWETLLPKALKMAKKYAIENL